MFKKAKGKDPRGGHVRIYWNILDSMAWIGIGYPSQSLYVVMRRKLQSTNNGNISATLGEMKHYGWRSSATLAKSLRELQAVGLIAVTRHGGIAFGQKVCSLYRFTDEPMYEHPKLGLQACGATNEWQKFKTKAEVCHAIKNNLGLQNVNQYGSYSEALTPATGSDNESMAGSPVQKMKKADSLKSHLMRYQH